MATRKWHTTGPIKCLFMVSQNNEDAIIASIFRRIGTTNKRFIEFGCGVGTQNNTIELLRQGWSGTWYDQRKRRCVWAKARWDNYPVEIKRRLVTVDNVNRLVNGPLDFLSIDIDGPDADVWEACTATPRVVCIEANYPMRLLKIADSKEYTFAGYSEYGINMFFIRGK